jgi:hypothetical protein
LWPDRFTAVLSPERVVLARRAGGPVLLAEAQCDSTSPEGAAQALSDLLARSDVGSGELTIVLSSYFVQYLLLPWRAEVSQPSELAAYAAICFDETFGNEGGGREILVGRERSGSARIAAAMETRLLTALRSAVAPTRLKLVSIQPYLPAVFDRVRNLLDPSDFLFVVAEPSRSCVMVATGGRWRSLRNAAATPRPQELAELIEREAQLAGLAEEGMPPVFVHAPGQETLEVPACHGVTPRVLPLPSGANDPLLAMAMTVN